MIFITLVFLTVFYIYLPWFDFTKTLSSGDWPYLFLQNIQAFKITTETPFLWLEPYYQITAKLGVQVFSLSWEVTEKLFWFYPFLIVSLISSLIFLKYLTRRLGIDKNSLVFISIGSLIFTTNTYILMLLGGGQIGVAVAYSLIPLVIHRVFTIMDDSKFSKKDFILSILILGVQLMFDPRIFALSVFVGFLYLLFTFVVAKSFSVKGLKRIILILFFSFLINIFWILPNLGYFNIEYEATVNAVGSDFLSFATFPNSISLLHPNWPENVFGKVGFMKPEFLILPILAYSSFLFLNSKVKTQKSKITILFFAFLGLVGAFLAKGTNPPFGELYIWLSSVPGFMIFRDPTKFYTLTVLSYMIILPFSVFSIYFWINSKLKSQSSKLLLKIQKYLLSMLFLFFICYWLFLIIPAVFGQLSGTFKPHEVLREYVSLKDFLNNQSRSFKTLWVPQVERFGFNSKTYPAISAIEIFKVSSLSGVLKRFEMFDIKNKLKEEDIGYVIIPHDYLGEIFLTDRKYDDRLYTQTITKLKNVNWLHALENNDFGRIKVFKVIY